MKDEYLEISYSFFTLPPTISGSANSAIGIYIDSSDNFYYAYGTTIYKCNGLSTSGCSSYFTGSLSLTGSEIYSFSQDKVSKYMFVHDINGYKLLCCTSTSTSSCYTFMTISYSSRGFAFDSFNNLYMADYSNSKVWKYSIVVPSQAPSAMPVVIVPSFLPTATPSMSLSTVTPSSSPTCTPSNTPSAEPSTQQPSYTPSYSPSTSIPTVKPTNLTPSPSFNPSTAPTNSAATVYASVSSPEATVFDTNNNLIVPLDWGTSIKKCPYVSSGSTTCSTVASTRGRWPRGARVSAR